MEEFCSLPEGGQQQRRSNGECVHHCLQGGKRREERKDLRDQILTSQARRDVQKKVVALAFFNANITHIIGFTADSTL